MKNKKMNYLKLGALVFASLAFNSSANADGFAETEHYGPIWTQKDLTGDGFFVYQVESAS